MIHQCEQAHKCSADLGNALIQILDTKLIYQPLLLLSDDDDGDDDDGDDDDGVDDDDDVDDDVDKAVV